MGVRSLDLADFLLIAEAALSVEVSALERVTAIHLAESALAASAAEFGGAEFYPEFPTKVAVLCERLARNHHSPRRQQARGLPLRSGIRRAQRLCMGVPPRRRTGRRADSQGDRGDRFG